MATNDSRPDDDGNFAPGVRVTESFGWNEYFGTAEALISAGLVREDQLPGRPGMPKSQVTFYAGQRIAGNRPTERDEKYLCVRITGKKYRVERGVPKEVRDRRRAAYEADLHAEREASRKAFSDKVVAEAILRRMVNSADEYREEMIRGLRDYVGLVRNGQMLPNNRHGYSVDESVVAELDDLLEEMIELVSNADVRFNAQRHQEIIYECKVDMAKGDGDFQRTLARISQGNRLATDSSASDLRK